MTIEDARPRKDFGRYLIGRLAEYGLVLVIAILINFLLPRALPGGPLRAFNPETVARMSQHDRDQLAAQYGFGKPLSEQFTDYIGGLATLDLGTSFADGEPVVRVLARTAPWTLLLVGTSLVLAFGIGLSLGVIGALRRRRGKGSGLLSTVLVLDSMPQFWLGMLFIVVFGLYLGVLPTFGEGATFAEVAEHLVLPVSTLVLTTLGVFFLYTRYSLLTVLTSEPVEHARARGVPAGRLVRRHALRPALLPVHTVLLVETGFLAGGAIVVETVFAYPGLGRLTFNAIRDHDYPLMQGAFLMLTVMVVAMNALADLTYPLLDPRVRRQR